ncbi:Uncharacterised protein [Serratia fonticola]|uniref:Uncharacterized protein n=1 Tax=Serratia fonticola TaxID=47917 RepID=A0A4U9T5Y8_SERFO|nr:Uncharacterised protein [Serratia fonticola]
MSTKTGTCNFIEIPRVFFGNQFSTLNTFII